MGTTRGPIPKNIARRLIRSACSTKYVGLGAYACGTDATLRCRVDGYSAASPPLCAVACWLVVLSDGGCMVSVPTLQREVCPQHLALTLSQVSLTRQQHPRRPALYAILPILAGADSLCTRRRISQTCRCPAGMRTYLRASPLGHTRHSPLPFGSPGSGAGLPTKGMHVNRAKRKASWALTCTSSASGSGSDCTR